MFKTPRLFDDYGSHLNLGYVRVNATAVCWGLLTCRFRSLATMATEREFIWKAKWSALKLFYLVKYVLFSLYRAEEGSVRRCESLCGKRVDIDDGTFLLRLVDTSPWDSLSPHQSSFKPTFHLVRFSLISLRQSRRLILRNADICAKVAGIEVSTPFSHVARFKIDKIDRLEGLWSLSCTIEAARPRCRN